MSTPTEPAPVTRERESLSLKWGVMKGWDFKTEATKALAQKYAALGWSMSAMSQPNTDAHRAVLCELIDALDADTVENDWTGDQMTKDEAKKYVMEYGK